MTSPERAIWITLLALALYVQYRDKDACEKFQTDLTNCNIEIIKNEGDKKAYKTAITKLIDRIGVIVKKGEACSHE